MLSLHARVLRSAAQICSDESAAVRLLKYPGGATSTSRANSVVCPAILKGWRILLLQRRGQCAGGVAGQGPGSDKTQSGNNKPAPSNTNIHSRRRDSIPSPPPQQGKLGQPRMGSDGDNNRHDSRQPIAQRATHNPKIPSSINPVAGHKQHASPGNRQQAAANSAVSARLRPHKSKPLAHLFGTVWPLGLCIGALSTAAYTGWQKAHSDPELARMLMTLPALAVLLVAGFIVSKLSAQARSNNMSK